ncbi:hypothetical protein [Agrobacterium tumefaciens]|uniref:hypothetical protein n=1 Tax=Agrobacterium tumefaciens TaxID=358 RepID=UPI0011477B16
MNRREQHNESVFRWYWKNICRAYQKAPHAFILGSGRETLAHWVHHTTGAWVTSAELRMHLEEAVRRGWMEMTRTPGECTRFRMVRK